MTHGRRGSSNSKDDNTEVGMLHIWLIQGFTLTQAGRPAQGGARQERQIQSTVGPAQVVGVDKTRQCFDNNIGRCHSRR